PWRRGGGGGGGGGWIEPWFGSEVWDPFGLGISDWEQQGGGDEPLLSLMLMLIGVRPTTLTSLLLIFLGLFAICQTPSKATKATFDYKVVCFSCIRVKKEDVKVHVEDGNMLQISGQRVQEQEKTEDKWHRVERQLGSFVRRFWLPKNADSDKIKCGLENEC
ncbi:HSP20-like chaperones superfamily protein, partial [Prunus dulcis]